MKPRAHFLLSVPALGLAASGLAGCGPDVQSVMAPAGSEAGQIAALAWLLFGLAAVVLAIVIAALWVAIRGSPRLRAMLAREKSIVALGLIFPAVTLTLLLGYGVWLMRPEVGHERGTVRIAVTGEQWWWRVAYPSVTPIAGAAPIAGANEITIPVGRPVEFILNAADVIHSFWVPSLGGKVDMIPGRTTRLRLTAERAGVYRGQCAEYCGGPHALMAFEVIALPPGAYDAWLAREAAPAPAPETAATRHGQALFDAAGCGACHAIRGTAANGTIGPDLTHLASRRSVGIDTMTLTHDHVKRFIAQNQHVKPGNRMPEFRVFAPDELDALANYLMSLR
jgi:cytochrome c oxidase subunit 2